MKLQFLGDSKDCFKWDYHDFLTRELGYDILNVVYMMTPDEETSHGQSKASIFPAGQHIVDLCDALRLTRNPSLVASLPETTGATYEVAIHRPSTHLNNSNRYAYFGDISKQPKQVIFLDPDNGFEPEQSLSEKHLSYQDVFRILDQAPDCAYLSVFHHFRRIKFDKDYQRIKERLNGLPSTAIAWNNSLMFVGIGKSQEVVTYATAVNKKYAQKYPRISIL